jgi:transglutaminase-like putative cysteine protease
MGGEADTFEAREYSDLDRTEDGLVVRVESRGVQADRVSESVQSWNGKGYDLVSRVAGLEEKHAVACAERCPTDTEMYLSKMLQDGRVAVGAHLEYQTPNFLAGRLDTVSLAVEAKEKLSLPGGEFDCFRVIETVSGAPADAKTTWWLDSAGVLRRLRSGRLEIVASTQAKARELRDGGAVYSITVEADPQMVRCTSLDRALVELTLAPRDDAEMPNIPATPFGREVSRDGNRIRVELTAHDEAALAVSLPVTDPKFAKHLERTNLFCWDAPRVKAALASAVGDEKDPQKIVTRILRYVFVNLRKSSGPIPEPTAVEILEDGGGDCSEHCVLFVTLCRAAGIPARRLSGYAQVGDMWGAHSFAEVWLGRWIGCDPTTNEFGTKARYVAFGWEDDPDSFPGLVSSRISGRVKIRTLEFTEGGRTWKTDGLENPSDRVDLLSGLAFADPPAGWYASVSGTGDGHFTGPGVRGDISTVAGYGDLPCDVLSQRMMRGWKTVKWAGRDTLRDDIAVHGHVTVRITVPFRRRMMSITMRVDDAKKVDAALETLAKLLAPTLD